MTEPRILTRRQFLRGVASVAAGAVVLPTAVKLFGPPAGGWPEGVMVKGSLPYNTYWPQNFGFGLAGIKPEGGRILYDGGDGVALRSTHHPLSNTEATPVDLNEAALEEMVAELEELTGGGHRIVSIRPKRVWFPLWI